MTQRPYNYRWQQERMTFLKLHPLCVYCSQDGRITASEVVDHITPHRGNEALFWDVDNWQALCKDCHAGFKQRTERKGAASYGIDGWPRGGGDEKSKD